MRRFPAVLLLLTTMSFFTALMLSFLFNSRNWIAGRQRKFHILDQPSLVVGQGVNSTTSGPSSPAYLTLFTTIKEIGLIPHHQIAFNIVLTNWPSFAPYVRPVLFMNFTNSSLADEARRSGWSVLPLQGVNPAGTPFLKDMYRAVFDRYESVFYGFANADILYDDSLVQTLQAIQGKLKELKNNVLVIGRRTNVNVNASVPIDLENFAKSQLRLTATTKGTLFLDSAIDYFLITKEGSSFNWSNFRNVVIGRPAYDNYLVAMANTYGVKVIDATETILAVHISEAGVHSHGGLNKDAHYNRRVIGHFDYDRGLTSRAAYATAYGERNKVLVGRRKPKKRPWDTVKLFESLY